MKRKKILLSMGTVAMILPPTIALMSCGSTPGQMPSEDIINTLTSKNYAQNTQYIPETKTLIINNDINSIDQGALKYFVDNKATMPISQITLPEHLKEIPSKTFDQFDQLITLIIPSETTSIDDEAFLNSPITSLTFDGDANGTLKIGSKAFNNMSISSITNVLWRTYANDHINANVFKPETIALTELNYRPYTIYNALTNKLTIMNVVTTMTFDSLNQDIIMQRSNSLQISKNMTDIPDFSFINFQLLSKLIIPDSISTIGAEAFENSQLLTTLHIPANVASIGESAFLNSPITSLTFDGDNKTTKLILDTKSFGSTLISSIQGSSWQTWATTKYPHSFI